MTEKDPANEPEVAEIQKLYLHRNLRGKGLGKIMMLDMIDKAKDIGFEKIYLTTRKEYAAAIGLYKHLGFVESSEEKYPGASKSIPFEMFLKE